MSLKGELLQEMEGLNGWEQKITTTHMKPLSWTKQQSPRDPEAPGALLHEDFTTCSPSVYPVTSGKKRPPRNTVGNKEKSMQFLLNRAFCLAFSEKALCRRPNLLSSTVPITPQPLRSSDAKIKLHIKYFPARLLP